MFVSVKLFDLVEFPTVPEKYSMCAKCEKPDFAAMYRYIPCMYRYILFEFLKNEIFNCLVSIQTGYVSIQSSNVSIHACYASIHTVLERAKISENGFDRIF